MKELLQFLAEVESSGLENEEPYFATPIEQTDIIVGEVPKKLRAFYLVLHQKINRTAASSAEFGCDDYDDLKDILEYYEAYEKDRIRELLVEMELQIALDDIFWVEIKKLFPEIIGRQKICIRDGWKIAIVCKSDEDSEDIDDDDDDDHWQFGPEPEPEPDNSDSRIHYKSQSEIFRANIIC